MNSTGVSNAVQSILGVVVGLVFTWMIVNYVPVESGVATLIIALVAVVAVTAAVLVWARRFRVAALGFAVASALMLLLLAVVVVA